jgi:hypothetical protein
MDGNETVMQRKLRLIDEARKIIVDADGLDERQAEELGECLVEYYGRADDACLSVEQLVGKMRVELARRRGAAMDAKEERGESDGKPLPTKERQRRFRAAAIYRRPDLVADYVEKVIAKGGTPSISAAAAHVKAVEKGEKAPNSETYNEEALRVAEQIDKVLGVDGALGKNLRDVLNHIEMLSPNSLQALYSALKLGKVIEDANIWLLEVEPPLKDEEMRLRIMFLADGIMQAGEAANEAAQAEALDDGAAALDASAAANPTEPSYEADAVAAE